jgi:hypothetical protein
VKGFTKPDAVGMGVSDAMSIDQRHEKIMNSKVKDEKQSVLEEGTGGPPLVPMPLMAGKRSQANDDASIATVRPPSRLSQALPIPALRQSQSVLNRQQSGTSAIGSQVSSTALIGTSAAAGAADNSSIASSGPISPSDAEDLVVAFRQAMRKAGEQ